MTQVLTAEQVFRAAEAYFRQGKLGIQHGQYGLYLNDNGTRCVVGAVLNENALSDVISNDLNGEGVFELAGQGIIHATDDDLELIALFQQLQDNILNRNALNIFCQEYGIDIYIGE